MTCPECGKVIAFTKPLQPADDAVTCRYCNHVVGSEELVWSDGQFHFDVVGDPTHEKISAKTILRDQKVRVLDLEKIHSRALQIIRAEPNLQALCGEFEITKERLRVVVNTEPTDETDEPV